MSKATQTRETELEGRAREALCEEPPEEKPKGGSGLGWEDTAGCRAAQGSSLQSRNGQVQMREGLGVGSKDVNLTSEVRGQPVSLHWLLWLPLALVRF